MPRGASAQRRMQLNRSRIDQVMVAVAHGLNDGLGQVALEISKRAPDSPYDPYPRYEGLPRQGGVLVYFDGKKIWSRRALSTEPKAPRAAKVSRTRGIVAILGWGFPARFNEYGTAHMPAHPFFTPTVEAMFPSLGRLMEPTVKQDLRRLRDERD